MKYQIKIASLFLAMMLVTCLTSCKGKEHRQTSKKMGSFGENTQQFLEGKVLDTMNAAGYTYLQLKTDKGTLWAAIPEAKVEKGEVVKVIPNMEMKNFKSKALNKTFDRIIFATGMDRGHDSLPSMSDTAHGQMPDGGMGMAMGLKRSKALALPKGFHVEKAKGQGGITVEEAYAMRKQLNGKTVKVNGYVVKVLAGIMGKNWIHIQDGTGDPEKGTSDLVVTTQDLPNPGDTVHVEGVLSSDKDFGAGYRYQSIIEDAHVTRLP